MMNLKVKVQYNNTVIAFAGSGVVLSKRSPMELIELALLGISSGDKSILNLFESLPSRSELQKMKMLLLEEA